ncbi:MAG: alanine racemase [Planctomycetota bacterium]
MYYHRVWADIDLAALAFNLHQISALVPSNTAIMPVLKADAYGHGAVRIARYIQKEHLCRNWNIWGFGVGDSNEALELRAAGIDMPILILGAIIEDEISKVIKNDISVCVHSERRAELLDREAHRQKKTCRVHLMIDTGMGRLGIFPSRALDLARIIASSKGLIFEGALTHCSCTSDLENPFTSVQKSRFLQVKQVLSDVGIYPEFFHASNSGALFASRTDPCNLVRPGIALYGICGSRPYEECPPLKPVMALKSQIIYMKDVPKDTPIGYDRLHITKQATRIATLPIGYNDGYPYRLSNRGQVLLKGKVAPVVGAVSMDYTMIDVGHIEGAVVGDLVTLIGQDGEASIKVESLAEWADTIPYEIPCRIGKRVSRLVVNGDGESEDQARGSERKPAEKDDEPGVELEAF